MSSAWQECRYTPTPGMLNGGVWQQVGKCRSVRSPSETMPHRRSFGATNRRHIEGVAVETSRDGSENRAIPREVLGWEPETPVQIDRKMFMKSMKTAPKGSSQGQEGAHTNICEYFWMKLPLWNCCWKQLPVWPRPRRRSRKL